MSARPETVVFILPPDQPDEEAPGTPAHSPTRFGYSTQRRPKHPSRPADPKSHRLPTPGLRTPNPSALPTPPPHTADNLPTTHVLRVLDTTSPRGPLPLPPARLTDEEALGRLAHPPTRFGCSTQRRPEPVFPLSPPRPDEEALGIPASPFPHFPFPYSPILFLPPDQRLLPCLPASPLANTRQRIPRKHPDDYSSFRRGRMSWTRQRKGLE